jgi:hypothetical protein
MSHHDLLERIADKAQQLLTLEQELVLTRDPQPVLEEVKRVRRELRELLQVRRSKDR